MMIPRLPAIRSERGWSAIGTLKYERRVGAAEPEAVGHHGIEFRVVDALPHDRRVGDLRIEFFNIGGFGDEAVLHLQNGINRLVHSGGAQRMAGEGFGGINGGYLAAE